MSSKNVPCIAVALHKQHTISEKMMLSGRVLVTMWLSGWIIIIVIIILVTDINKVSVSSRNVSVNKGREEIRFLCSRLADAVPMYSSFSICSA